MKFIETTEGFINLAHVIQIVCDDRTDEAFAVHANGETKILGDVIDREPLAMMQIFTAPAGYKCAHLNFREDPADAFLLSVIAFYISNTGDGGVRAVLEDDGTVSRLHMDIRTGYAALLVTPDGRLSDGDCYSFSDVGSACAELIAEQNRRWKLLAERPLNTLTHGERRDLATMAAASPRKKETT